MVTSKKSEKKTPPPAASAPSAKRVGSPVTLYDVSALAKVSPMTVSRVVNGNVNVSEATRARVLKAIDELGYRVNVAARAARIGTLRLGLLFSNPSAAYLSALLVGVLSQCRESGAELVLENVEDPHLRLKALESLLARGVDGLLVPPPLCDSRSAMKRVLASGKPTVAVATARPALEVSAVRIDDYEAACAMTRKLLALGHRDIAFLKGDPEHTPAQLRFRAFIVTMREAGLIVSDDRVLDGMFTYRSGLESARRLLVSSRRPTAIFAANDDMAAGALAVAHGLHIRVPEELAIAGFDDTPVATTVWPELTTVHQPIGDMGRVAVKILVQQIKALRSGQPSVVVHQLLPFRLVERGSTRA